MNTNDKKREFWVDNLRIIACFMVLITHSVMESATGGNTERFWMFSISYLCNCSSELFLAISGALLLPTKVSMQSFYKRRFGKLIPPMIFWSVLIIVINNVKTGFDFSALINSVIMLPFKSATGVYWFLYVMIGLYLIAPIISKWLIDASKKEVELFLILWGLTLIWPYCDSIISIPFTESGSHYYPLNYFGGFLGYWILGHYLYKYPITIGWNARFVPLVTLLLSHVILIGYCKGVIDYDTYNFQNNLQIGSAIYVTFIFTIVQNIRINNSSIQGFITSLAQYSFGIYLVHSLLINNIFKPILENCRTHPLIEAPLIAALTVITAYILMKLLSRLPFSKYIIGV